jgi:hydrogenase/urease accessory protein HupE
MRLLAPAVLGALAIAAPVAAHPAPFSYADVSVGERNVDVAVVAHVYDLAHDLEMDDPEDLLDSAVLARRAEALGALLSSRFEISTDGGVLPCRTSAAPSPAPDQQSVRLRFSCPIARPPGVLRVRAALFSYDPKHQTFLNVYDHGALQAQAILDREHLAFDYFAGSRQGVVAVVRRFVPAGIHHILIGPDHLLFLVGLLLLGGSLRQLALVVTAFTLAHSLTLTLAVFGLVNVPSRVVEPAIALSIVYVGIDNLMVRSGRDLRPWIALGFGLIHGFGFASVLREMDLPRRSLGWSLFSFNVGVEIGQLTVVLVVASALAALRSRSEPAGRRLAVIGSVAVVAAGSVWFVERLLFP